MNDALQHHLKHLVDDRAIAVAARDVADLQVKAKNKLIFSALTEAQSGREQLLDGTTVSIVQPKPRETVKPEKLLGLGVSPDVIRAATTSAPVEPYIRVDAPGAPKSKDDAREIAHQRNPPIASDDAGDAPESRPH
jgi:hypothetical protein